MTLYDLLLNVDCHTVVKVYNVDRKENIEAICDGVIEPLEDWYNTTVDYIRCMRFNYMYIEVREL